MKTFITQAIKFFLTSGIGWIIDFSVFIILTAVWNFPIGISNFVSAIPAVTFVFIVSTRKIFLNNNSKLKVSAKYVIYLAYQVLIVSCVSFVSQILYNQLGERLIIVTDIPLVSVEIVIKIFITPVTMLLNFITMKTLVEKI